MKNVTDKTKELYMPLCEHIRMYRKRLLPQTSITVRAISHLLLIKYIYIALEVMRLREEISSELKSS